MKTRMLFRFLDMKAFLINTCIDFNFIIVVVFVNYYYYFKIYF